MHSLYFCYNYNRHIFFIDVENWFKRWQYAASYQFYIFLCILQNELIKRSIDNPKRKYETLKTIELSPEEVKCKYLL